MSYLIVVDGAGAVCEVGSGGSLGFEPPFGGALVGPAPVDEPPSALSFAVTMLGPQPQPKTATSAAARSLPSTLESVHRVDSAPERFIAEGL